MGCFLFQLYLKNQIFQEDIEKNMKIDEEK